MSFRWRTPPSTSARTALPDRIEARVPASFEPQEHSQRRGVDGVAADAARDPLEDGPERGKRVDPRGFVDCVIESALEVGVVHDLDAAVRASVVIRPSTNLRVSGSEENSVYSSGSPASETS